MSSLIFTGFICSWSQSVNGTWLKTAESFLLTRDPQRPDHRVLSRQPKEQIIGFTYGNLIESRYKLPDRNEDEDRLVNNRDAQFSLVAKDNKLKLHLCN